MPLDSDSPDPEPSDSPDPEAPKPGGRAEMRFIVTVGFEPYFGSGGGGGGNVPSDLKQQLEKINARLDAIEEAMGGLYGGGGEDV